MQDHLIRRKQFIKDLVSICRKHHVMLDEPDWSSVNVESFIFREYCSTSSMSFLVDVEEIERVLREELWDEIHLKKKSEQTAIVIYRVRELEYDGGTIGKTWSEEFYLDIELAKDRQRELVESSNARNPQHLFDDVLNDIEGHSGYYMRRIRMDMKDMQYLNYQMAQSSIGEEFYVYRGKNKYEGPVVLDKISKAGHCVVLSEFKLEPPSLPAAYINHKQGQRFRSTIQTPWLARRKPTLKE